MKRRLTAAVFLAALLAACNRSHPYREQGNPPGQNPAGTPADRTGGARNVPDGAGGGPGKKTAPADQKK